MAKDKIILIDIRTQVDEETHLKIKTRQLAEEKKGNKLTLPEVAAMMLKECK